MLRELVDYEARQPEPTPTLYTLRPLRYLIFLDLEGRPVTREPLDLADPSEKASKRGKAHHLPSIQRANKIKPILLADKADYTLGVAEGAERGLRAVRAHDAYVDLVRRCADATKRPEVIAVARFLERDPLESLTLGDDFDHAASISFQVGSAYVVDLPEVRTFWAGWNATTQASRLQCIVCGEFKPALDRLQLKVKGIPGGQTAGTSLISANAEAFESYGLKASLISPTCSECGEGFTKGLNRLLAGESTSIRVGQSVYVFWTRHEEPFAFINILSRPEPGEVRALINSARQGGLVSDPDSNAFYAMSLSASGGRAVVRDTIESTVTKIKLNLACWFDRQSVVNPNGSDPTPLGIWSLAAATVRELRDVSPNVPAAIIRSALQGTPLPERLLFAAVKRNISEQGVSHQRAALIKTVIASQPNSMEWKEKFMVQLNADLANPAYQCGRLLAVLERAQWSALGIRSVAKRFYGAASTAPASVFGRLMQGVVPHLAKLERDKPGAYHGIQRSIEEVVERIDQFPRTLTLRDQGLFALGYYHQRAADRAAQVTHGTNDEEE